MKSKEREKEAKLKLFYRLLMSYNDFQQASEIASYILDHRLQEKVKHLRGNRRYRIRQLWQALNCAMVVSYCRPFSGNGHRTAKRIPVLPGRFLKALTAQERELHAEAMENRNTLLAHSDSDAWNMRPFFLETTSGRKMLLPLSDDPRAPFVHAAVEQFAHMCTKLMELVFQERKKLEKEIGDLLPTMSPSQVTTKEKSEQE